MTSTIIHSFLAAHAAKHLRLQQLHRGAAHRTSRRESERHKRSHCCTACLFTSMARLLAYKCHKHTRGLRTLPSGTTHAYEAFEGPLKENLTETNTEGPIQELLTHPPSTVKSGRRPIVPLIIPYNPTPLHCTLCRGVSVGGFSGSQFFVSFQDDHHVPLVFSKIPDHFYFLDRPTDTEVPL